MKRRLTIARSLINRPDLLLLDEPTTGLDPQARHLLWDRLYRLKREGVTLVLTTHYMDEAEQLCDRLVIMDDGRIVAEGSPRELIDRYATREVVELRFPTPEDQAFAAEQLTATETSDGVIASSDGVVGFDRLDAATRVEPLADRLLVYADDGDRTVADIVRRGFTPESTLVRRGSLEDVFLHLTGRSLED
jgi:lipooligosaccharide transport system ATP-binding protein